MPLSYTELRDAIESSLRDSSNTYFSADELDYNITEGLRTIARYKKHLVKITYQIESRHGSATSTSSGNLVDATKDQFASTDVGKRVFNDTDKTWADVISYTDAETLGLSHDIFASGENYYLYNKGCWNNKQINIEGVGDHLWVESVQYPIGRGRVIDSIRGGILQIGLDREPDDSDPNNTDGVIDVYVYFAKRHKLSQLTDFAGAVDNAGGYSKGATSMAINLLQGSGTIEEDQEFTLASRDQVYTITASATITSNAATITFYPGLDADVANAVVVTLVQSTFDRELEMLLINWVVGKALMDEANLHLPAISQGGTGTYRRYFEIASARYNEAIRRLQKLAEPKPTKILSRL